MPTGWISRHPVAAFLAVAFGWTVTWDVVFTLFDLWTVMPVSIPRVWGPAIAAVVVAWAGETPVRAWLAQVLDWRVNPLLYIAAVVIPIAITNVQPVVEGLGGSVGYDPPAAIYYLPVWIALNMVLLGGTEELGWRGVLQPRWQQRVSVFTAGLAVGVAWWAWHLPLWFVPGTELVFEPGAFVTYTVFILGASTVLGGLVNLADGSVLPAMLMHASVNAGAFLAATGGVLDGSILVPLVVGAGLWWMLAAGLVYVYGWSMAPGEPVEPVA